MPTLPPDAAVVHACPKEPGVTTWPPSGGKVCFTVQGIEAEVEAENAVTSFAAIGPLLPLFPFCPAWFLDERGDPLRIDVWFKAPDGYEFSPSQVSVQTERGETIRVSGVLTDFHIPADDARPGEVDARARRPLPASQRYLLRFEKRVGPEQSFSLVLHLTAPDGAELRLPTITFRQGRVSVLGAIP